MIVRLEETSPPTLLFDPATVVSVLMIMDELLGRPLWIIAAGGVEVGEAWGQVPGELLSAKGNLGRLPQETFVPLELSDLAGEMPGRLVERVTVGVAPAGFVEETTWTAGERTVTGLVAVILGAECGVFRLG